MIVNKTTEDTRVRTDATDEFSPVADTHAPSWESPSLPTFRAVQYEGRFQIVHVPTGYSIALDSWTEPEIALRVARRFVKSLPKKLRSEIRKAKPKWSDKEKILMKQYARAAIHWGMMLQYRYVDLLQAQSASM